MNRQSEDGEKREADLLSEALGAEGRGLYGKAIGLLERSLGSEQAREKRLRALLLLGTLYDKRSMSEEGYRYLEEGLKVLEADKEAPGGQPAELVCRAQLIMADLLESQGNHEGAEVLLRKCLSGPMRQDSATKYVGLGILARVLAAEGRHLEAIEVLRQRVAEAEASGYSVYQARKDVASSLAEAGRLEEAYESIIEAIHSNPSPHPSEMARFLRIAAVIASKRNMNSLAKDYVREAEHYLQYEQDVERRNDDAVQIGRLAQIHGEMNVLLRIGRLLSNVEETGRRGEGVGFLARALYELGRDEECLLECEKALGDGGTDAEVAAGLRELAIYAASHLGRWEDARDHFRKGQGIGLTLENRPELESYLKDGGEGLKGRLRRWLGVGGDSVE